MCSAWSACVNEAADLALKPGKSQFRHVCRTLPGCCVRWRFSPTHFWLSFSMAIDSPMMLSPSSGTYIERLRVSLLLSPILRDSFWTLTCFTPRCIFRKGLLLSRKGTRCSLSKIPSAVLCCRAHTTDYPGFVGQEEQENTEGNVFYAVIVLFNMLLTDLQHS
jgi:hypothetical protein